MTRRRVVLAAAVVIAVLAVLGASLWEQHGQDAPATPAAGGQGWKPSSPEAFLIGGYVPIQCGPYRPGERVSVTAKDENGNSLFPGDLWEHMNVADATGWLRGFAATDTWPKGNVEVDCTGESGRVYRTVAAMTDDPGRAIRFAPDVWPQAVTPGRSLGVYVRVLESGFRPSEEMLLTVKSPNGTAYRLPGEADGAGNAAFVVRVDPGDLPGVWKGKVRGVSSHHEAAIRYEVEGNKQ